MCYVSCQRGLGRGNKGNGPDDRVGTVLIDAGNRKSEIPSVRSINALSLACWFFSTEALKVEGLEGGGLLGKKGSPQPAARKEMSAWFCISKELDSPNNPCGLAKGVLSEPQISLQQVDTFIFTYISNLHNCE